MSEDAGEALPPFDTHAVMAALRKQDPEAMDLAYRITFGNELGRIVLADMMAHAGVGRKYAGAPDLYSVGYHQGGHDLVLEFMERAGFDPASAVLTVMTGQLEGRDDELSAQAEPDPELPE